MEDKLNVLKTHTLGVSLTAEEKARGREHLSAYMTYRPVRIAGAPHVATANRGFWHATLGRGASAVAVFTMLFATTAGVSYAAEDALPGDRLYAVKIGFNEEVRDLLAWSPERRAVWEGERAARRLAEAEELARDGQLKMETRIALDARFRQHSADAQQHLAQIRTATDGAGAAADISAHIEGTWRAHRQIMDAIVEQRRGLLVAGQDDTEEGEYGQVTQLAATVERETASAASWMGATEATAIARGTSAAQSFAEGRRNVASSRIAETRSWLARQLSSLSSDVRKQAMAALERADVAVVAGNEALARQDFTAAFSSYAMAQSIAQEVKTAVSASNRLKVTVRFIGDVAPAATASAPAPAAEAAADARIETDATSSADPKPAWQKPSVAVPAISIPVLSGNAPVPTPSVPSGDASASATGTGGLKFRR